MPGMSTPPPKRSPRGAPPRPATPAAPARRTGPAAAPPRRTEPLAASPRSEGPLSEAEMATLEDLLDQLPDSLEPLDTVMLDGYLCGVLLQPRPVAEAQWLRHIVDIDGRAAPTRFPMAEFAALVRRRHAELDRAIARRQWFDPWVYELDDEAGPVETVLPWVAGFSVAMDAFASLLQAHEDELLEPLATLYRYFDPEDLEDAEALQAEIETLEPPRDLAEAVEDLVRSVLLIADVSRPHEAPSADAAAPAHPPRGSTGRGPGGVRQTPGGRGRPGPGPRSRNGPRGAG